MEVQALQRWQDQPQRFTQALTEGSATSTVAFLQQMRTAEVEVNVFHYCAAMSVCTKASKWFSALDCFEEYLSSASAVDVPLVNSKLKALAKCGWDAALEGLHAVQAAGKIGIEVDTVSFNASMGGADWQHALAFPQIMQQEDVAASVVTFNCSMVAQGPEHWPWALQILSGMHQHRLSNDVTLTAILGTLQNNQEMTLWCMALAMLEDGAMWSSKVGWKKGHSVTVGLCDERWELAMALLREDVDVVGYSSAIAACEKAGRWQLTLLILERMSLQKVIANNFSYNSAMSACGKHSAWCNALELFEEMLSFRVEQDVVTYNALLEALVEGQSGSGSDGGPATTAACLASMTQAMVVPNLITYSTTLMAFEKANHWQEGLDLLQLMPGKLIQLDVISYNSAMSACQKGKHWQMAWRLLKSTATVISFGILCDGPWHSSLEALRVKGLIGTATVTPLAAAALSCERGRVARPLMALLHQLDQASAAWLQESSGWRHLHPERFDQR